MLMNIANVEGAGKGGREGIHEHICTKSNFRLSK